MIPLGELGEIMLKEREVFINDISRTLGVSIPLLRSLLQTLPGVSVSGDKVSVHDRMELVLALMSRGVEAARLSQYLSWREFEEYSSRVLEKLGYSVVRNLRLYKPKRLQIDVMAWRSRVVMVVDCKHWSPRSTVPSRLRTVALEHRRRVKALVGTSRFHTILRGGLSGSSSPGELYVYPILVTLSGKHRGVVERVSVVPISSLASLVRDFDLYRFDLPHIRVSPS